MILKSQHVTLTLSIIGSVLFSSCSTPLLKARPAKLSAFLEHSPTLKNERKTTPFHLSGGTLTAPQQGIYIASVSLDYLRPATKLLARAEGSDAERKKAAKELAIYGRRQFMLAFQKSPAPRYQLLLAPNPDCLVLELAITEFHQNTFTGSLMRLAVHPALEPVLTKATPGLKGNIAIEGKLRSSATGEILYQFADSEESRSYLIPVTDFTPNGQAREALRAWARQFEELTRSPPGKRVRDTTVISLF